MKCRASISIQINSRVMVDKATFRRINPNWDNLSLPKGAGNEFDNVSNAPIPSDRSSRHGRMSIIQTTAKRTRKRSRKSELSSV